MAGSWIKMRNNLWDDPRVSALVDVTDSSEAAVVGGLYWIWSAADEHSVDGNMPGLSVRQIDRKTGVPGLGEALVAVGWIEEITGGVRICRFEEHNGASAKRRASESRRKMSARDADIVRTESGQSAHLDREIEEERDIDQEQEQKQKKARKRAAPSESIASIKGVPVPPKPDDVSTQTWADWLGLRKAKVAPVTVTVLDDVKREAAKAGLTLTRFLEIWCARGSQGLQADWLKPNERAGPAKPSASASFHGKTYTGTPDHELPESLRP